MNQQVTESVANKIRQLFAMAEHPNSNENEAAIALEKAQELLFRHNLTRGDIVSPDNTASTAAPGIGKIDGTESDGYVWKRYLLNVIAKNSLCSVVVSPSKKQWHLFGTYDNVKAVLEMYHWITPELERIALTAWREYKANGGYESARTWKQSFFMGASNTINKRLAESLNTFSQYAGRELVIYNKDAVSTAVRKIFPCLGHASSRYSGSSAGYSAGQRAGSNLHLRPQHKLSTGRLALGYK